MVDRDAKPVRPDSLEGAAASPRQHPAVATLLFADVVGSTALKQALGDHAGIHRLQEHHQVVRRLIDQFAGAEECFAAGDSFLILFSTPSDAVRFALVLQSRLREFNEGQPSPVSDRIGLHLGEVMIEESADGIRDVHGIQVDTCSRVMSLAHAGQILLTRPVFDNARLSLKGESIEGASDLSWLNHGRFLLQGIEEPVEICEVRSATAGALSPPTTSSKARRQTDEGAPVLGWRPAVGQLVPNTPWVLERNLGEGGFGEVWVGRHPKLGERRVFKFCFRSDRARSLRREVALFRLIKERVGDHPNIVRVLEVDFEEPPYYVEMDYLEGQDLPAWCEAQGGARQVPLETRLEIVAQIGDALQAAHQAGILHRDVKPRNILVAIRRPVPDASESVLAKLTDFGIGQVIDEESLAGATHLGATATLVAGDSAPSGTQLYLAPERLAGQPASTRSDIYSLGVVLYQLLLGDFRRPVTTDWADSIDDPLLREDLHRCFAGSPDDRFEAAGQLSRNLRSWAARGAARSAAERDAREREHLQRKMRQRHRLLVAAAAMTLFLGAIVLALAYGLHQAETARRDALAERERQRRYAYASDIKAAHIAWLENNRGMAVNLLQRHVPSSGQTDLRGVEWRYLWQASRGDELRQFRHPAMVHTAALSPDARFLATAAQDNRIRIWDVATGRLLHELPAFVPPGGLTRCLVFSPAGRLVASTRDGLRIIDPDSGTSRVLAALGGPPVSISPDGASVVSGHARQADLFLWDLSDGSGRSLPGSVGIYNALAFGPRHAGIACPTPSQAEVQLFDPETAIPKTLGPCGRLTACAFSPDGHWLACGNWDGEVLVWDLVASRFACRMRAHQGLVFGLGFSPDSHVLATGGNDQLIHLWTAGSSNRIATLHGHVSEIWSLEFSRDGRWLISGSKDGTARLWAADRGSSTASSFSLSADHPVQGALPGGSALVGMDTSRGVASFQDWNPDSPPRNVPLDGFDAAGPAAVAAFPEDNLVVAIDAHGTVTLWDLASGRRLRSIALGGDPFKPLCVSPNRRWLLGLLPNRTAELADLESGNRGRLLPDLAFNYASVAFSPDSRWLAYATAGFTIQVMELATGRSLASLAGHQWFVLALRFSPDGRMLASGSTDSSIRLWSTKTFRPVLPPMVGHQSGVGCLVFTPDGRTLVSDGDDQTVRWWSVATGQELLQWRDASIRSLYSISARAVWSPGETTLFWRERDGGTRIVRLPTLDAIAELEGGMASGE